MKKITVSFKKLESLREWACRRRAGFIFWNKPTLVEVNDEQLKLIKWDKYLTIHPFDSTSYKDAERFKSIEVKQKEDKKADTKRRQVIHK